MNGSVSERFPARIIRLATRVRHCRTPTIYFPSGGGRCYGFPHVGTGKVWAVE
ncbi:MAG: hypothetical protein LBI62_07390 [Candidatus Accumulibacter sp.]|nr:hypothetical protein [Accumulibacter sp.]